MLFKKAYKSSISLSIFQSPYAHMLSIPDYKSEEDEINDLEETQIRYSQYLLEMTFQQKLSSKTVDTLNYHTKRLFDSSLMVFKVFFILVFKILKFYFDMF
jgi:hypothetical protein